MIKSLHNVGIDSTFCNSNIQEAGESKVLGLARLHRLHVQRAKLPKRYKKLKRKRKRKGKRLKVTKRNMEKEEDRERERERKTKVGLKIPLGIITVYGGWSLYLV